MIQAMNPLFISFQSIVSEEIDFSAELPIREPFQGTFNSVSRKWTGLWEAVRLWEMARSAQNRCKAKAGAMAAFIDLKGPQFRFKEPP
jgi:hypothetical protein